MTDNRSTVVGVFDNRDQVQCAENALHNAGFNDNQIGVAMRGQTGRKTETQGNEAPEGAATGAVAGGIVGGLIGAGAALLLPGVGPVLAGGILATTLAGAAAGAVAGGVLGALVGMGIPEEQARYYDQEFRQGRIIMTAKAGDRYDQVRTIFRDCGAYDIENRAAATAPANAPDEQTMRLREEKLDVHKEPVQTGEVDIHKEVVTDTESVDVPVSREEVVIERKDLKDRPAGENVGEDKQIRIPLSEEQVHVEKKPVETEEIRVHKEVASDTKRVTEDTKREEARVERKGDTSVRGGKDLNSTNPDEET